MSTVPGKYVLFLQKYSFSNNTTLARRAISFAEAKAVSFGCNRSRSYTIHRFPPCNLSPLTTSHMSDDRFDTPQNHISRNAFGAMPNAAVKGQPNQTNQHEPWATPGRRATAIGISVAERVMKRHRPRIKAQVLQQFGIARR